MLMAARVAAARVDVGRREGVVLCGDDMVVVDVDAVGAERWGEDVATAALDKRVWRRVGGGMVVGVVVGVGMVERVELG